MERGWSLRAPDCGLIVSVMLAWALQAMQARLDEKQLAGRPLPLLLLLLPPCRLLSCPIATHYRLAGQPLQQPQQKVLLRDAKHVGHDAPQWESRGDLWPGVRGGLGVAAVASLCLHWSVHGCGASSCGTASPRGQDTAQMQQ